MREQKKKRTNLTKEIGVSVSIILVIVFSILITSTVYSARSAILTATNNNLQSVSMANGCQIQEFMNICQTTANSLVSFIEKSIQQDTLSPALIASDTSVVYPGLSLSRVKKELENYMIATASNAVEHNPAVIGIGIMFEPFQFSKDRESYALYFTEEEGSVTVSDVGAYDEFSANEYYQIVSGKTDTYFTKPYTYRDMWMITGATPIIYNGTQIGVINVDVTMDEFNNLKLENTSYPSLNVQLVSADGTIDFNSGNMDSIGQAAKDVMFKNSKDVDRLISSISSNTEFSIQYTNKDGKSVKSFCYPLKAGAETWQVATTVANYDIQKSSVTTIVMLGIFCVASLIVILVVLILILRKKINPIHSIVGAAQQISEGNLDIDLKNIKSNNEIGLLAETFQMTSVSLKKMILDISRVLGELSRNNFAVEVEAEYKGAFTQIKDSVQEIIFNLNRVMVEIGGSSQLVSQGAQQLSTSSDSLTTTSEDQITAIQTLHQNVQQVNGQVEASTQNAIDASRLVRDMESDVKEGNNQMKEMIGAISNINESSQNIEVIIGNIEGIASQTNLLSLNAAVEAARAGEAGKGFAVVAEEIRALANQSAEAANHTRDLIQESRAAVENGTSVAVKTENALKSLFEKIERIAQMVESIAKASGQQKSSISTIEESVGRISDTVNSTSNMAGDYAATSEELFAQAESLDNLVKQFHFNKSC